MQYGENLHNYYHYDTLAGTTKKNTVLRKADTKHS